MSTSVKAPESVPPTPPAKKGMQSSTKLVIGIFAFLGLSVISVVLGLFGLFQVSSVVDDEQPPVLETPIADGEWFAFVTVGTDESGAIVPGVDLAEMLSGQEAHDAAVEAGVITEDEDLPNDFFIRNEAVVLELMKFSDDAEIKVISAVDVSSYVDVTAEQLVALYNGTYVGSEVYGVAVGQPIAMDIVVENGEIVSAVAVYLP